MSTKLHDLARQAILNTGLTPRTVTASVNGSSVDLLAGKIQESADGTTWTDISGATFTTVTATDNVQAITFDRSQRYVRYVGAVGGTSPSFALAVFISEQKKQV